MEVSKPRLKRHSTGRWIVEGFHPDCLTYAVRCGRRSNAWELQYEDGTLAFGDGFEGLRHVRGWLEDQFGEGALVSPRKPRGHKINRSTLLRATEYSYILESQ